MKESNILKDNICRDLTIGDKIIVTETIDGMEIFEGVEGEIIDIVFDPKHGEQIHFFSLHDFYKWNSEHTQKRYEWGTIWIIVGNYKQEYLQGKRYPINICINSISKIYSTARAYTTFNINGPFLEYDRKPYREWYHCALSANEYATANDAFCEIKEREQELFWEKYEDERAQNLEYVQYIYRGVF